jgi:hypothetical protein
VRASGSRIWLYAGPLTCGRMREDGPRTESSSPHSVSSGGRDTFDSDSMLVARCPLARPSGGSPPMLAGALPPDCPSSYMGIAALSLVWLFLSSPPACICMGYHAKNDTSLAKSRTQD